MQKDELEKELEEGEIVQSFTNNRELVNIETRIRVSVSVEAARGRRSRRRRKKEGGSLSF